MALHLPPSVTINKFQSGYLKESDYTDLPDDATNDAQNVIYTEGSDVEQRLGSSRLYNTHLTSTGTSSARPITGHFFFAKNGDSSTINIVAAGDSLFRYNSSTATSFLTGMTDDSQTYWQFCQVQDPRDASDDITIMTNGVDSIMTWEGGTTTAVALSSFGSAVSVPVGKYILEHKRRVYVANITDNTDADSEVRVVISSFGPDGAPDPHRFLSDFYCGGSSRDGAIQGFRVLNDQLVIITRRSTWKFNPGNGLSLDTRSLQQLERSIGCLAPRSIADAGQYLIWLSDQGVYAFDGTEHVHLSKKIDSDLFSDAERSRLPYAQGVYDPSTKQYKLYYAKQGSVRNDRAVIYDIEKRIWQPPVEGREVSIISVYEDASGKEKVVYGDYFGQLYEDESGNNDGLTTGYNGLVDSSTPTTLTDTDAAFTTTGSGLKGMLLKIIDGTGVEQSRRILTNDSQTLTLETGFSTLPDTSSTYTVGAIDSYWRSKDYSFGAEDITKIFRHVRVRPREEGNVELDMHYIVDFRDLAAATKKAVLLLGRGFTWGVSTWGSAVWGAAPVIVSKVSLRSSYTQPLQGTHFALRYSNRKANQKWRVIGYDIEVKPIGKR